MVATRPTGKASEPESPPAGGSRPDRARPDHPGGTPSGLRERRYAAARGRVAERGTDGRGRGARALGGGGPAEPLGTDRRTRWRLRDRHRRPEGRRGVLGGAE